jgi:hypothetical protein
MKKLQNLGRSLSKNELKALIGGVATCQAQVQITGGTTVVTGLTQQQASTAANMIHWCCDSCSSATWAIK